MLLRFSENLSIPSFEKERDTIGQLRQQRRIFQIGLKNDQGCLPGNQIRTQLTQVFVKIAARLVVHRVNWRGQFAVIRAFAPLLKASGNGLIVSLSSIAGTNGIGSSIAYCAVKAGID